MIHGFSRNSPTTVPVRYENSKSITLKFDILSVIMLSCLREAKKCIEVMKWRRIKIGFEAKHSDSILE